MNGAALGRNCAICVHLCCIPVNPHPA